MDDIFLSKSVEFSDYHLSKKDEEKVAAWLKETVWPQCIANQRKEHTGDHVYETLWELGYPYLGAIGGGTTFHFTDTSLGPIIKVTHPDCAGGEFEIDITEYDCW